MPSLRDACLLAKVLFDRVPDLSLEDGFLISPFSLPRDLNVVRKPNKPAPRIDLLDDERIVLGPRRLFPQRVAGTDGERSAPSQHLAHQSVKRNASGEPRLLDRSCRLRIKGRLTSSCSTTDATSIRLTSPSRYASYGDSRYTTLYGF